jgi:preprotein translocase subunit SecE
MAEEGPVEDAVPNDEPSALDQVTAPRRAPVEHERPAGGNRLLSFLGHVVDELRRVQWPDRRQVGQSTLVVLLFVIIAGGYLGLLDAIWQPLIKAIL